MEKNKCYNDDLLACQKKLVILELCPAHVYVGICAQTHVCRYTGQVASARAHALGLGNTVTKENITHKGGSSALLRDDERKHLIINVCHANYGWCVGKPHRTRVLRPRSTLQVKPICF